MVSLCSKLTDPTESLAARIASSATGCAKATTSGTTTIRELAVIATVSEPLLNSPSLTMSSIT